MKIGIVGTGLVGSASAYAMVMRGIGREIVLVDRDEKRSQAEADDISHAVPFSHPLRVIKGDFADLQESRLVVVSAGVSQRPGETRLELLRRNAAVFGEVVPKILQNASDVILVIATNPVDVMTHLATLYAADYGVPASKVIGTGTTLDTARFRALLGQYLGVDPHHVHAYVVGEHGDSEVLTWSLVTIGGMQMLDFCTLQGLDLNEEQRQFIDQEVRNAAYTIIEGKGSTYYGIGSAVARIAEIILHDQRSILTISTRTSEVAGVPDATVSLPRLIAGDGVVATFPPSLDDSEHAALKQSAQMVRRAIDEVLGWMCGAPPHSRLRRMCPTSVRLGKEKRKKPSGWIRPSIGASARPPQNGL